MDLADVRVQTGDVGGSFGFKIFLHPEQICIAWAARKLGQWCGGSKAVLIVFYRIYMGVITGRRRAQQLMKGSYSGAQVTAHANMGAWLSNFSTYIPTLSGCRTLTTVYDIKAASLQVIGVMTNTPAVDAYRGAGRPEANYLMERLMDHIAAETGHSRLDVRRVNMIKAVQMPYEMVSGGTIDLGEIPQLFEDAIKQADVAGFASRRNNQLSKTCFAELALGCILNNVVVVKMKG